MKCSRCSGLIVCDYFCGGEGIFNAWSYEGERCVNCGAIAARPLSWSARRKRERRHAPACRHSGEKALVRNR